MFSFFTGAKSQETEIKEKNIETTYHWKNLRERLRQFDECKIEVSDEKDEECYKKLRQAFEEGVTKGELSEGKNIVTKKMLSGEATSMSKKIFQEYGCVDIPPILGVKTLAFVKSNYLPYYYDSQHVKFTANDILQQKVMNLFVSGKQEEYRKKAGLLEVSVKEFSEKNPELAKQAEEFVKKIMPKIDVSIKPPVENKVEEVKAPSLT